MTYQILNYAYDLDTSLRSYIMGHLLFYGENENMVKPFATLSFWCKIMIPSYVVADLCFYFEEDVVCISTNIASAWLW